MNNYTYKDVSKWPLETSIVFECDANNIDEADKKYQDLFGKHPSREKFIVCLIGTNDGN